MTKAEATARGRRVWWAPFALAIASACWGVSVPISKKAVDVLPPVTLLSMQLLVSIVVLWVALLLRPRQAAPSTPPISRADLYKACLSGLLQPGLTFMLVTLGLLLTTASEVVLLDAIEPILILAMAAVLLKERLSPLQYLCSLGAIVGAALVILPQINLSAMSWPGLSGDALVLAGLCVAAFYVILSRRLIAAYDGLRLAAVQQTAAAIFAGVVLLIASVIGVPALPANVISGEIIALVILSGLLQFALPFWLYLQALRHMRASITALFLPIIPLSGVVTAYFLLGEVLAPVQWIGAILIVGTVLVSSLLSDASH